MSYIILNGIPFAIEKATGGRIVPPGKDDSEAWTYKVEGGLIPPWIRRLARGKKDFWRSDPELDGVGSRNSESDVHSDSQDIAALEGIQEGRAKTLEKGQVVA